MRWPSWIGLGALLVGCPCLSLHAAEGMFLLDALPAPALQRARLKISPAELQRRAQAVIQVAQGGTGSFVSDRGLVVTNHHVAYGCIARLGAQPAHQGLLERGHLARSLDQELPCPGYDLLVVKEVRDVAAQIKAAVKPRMSWAARAEALRLAQADLEAECERQDNQICEVAPLDGGVSYLLSVYRRIRDVRLVYAPPKDLGKFGGDIDNWTYPRHTADFTFLRAYVSPQGQAADYDGANVPLKTPVHLALSPFGVKRGSLTEVIGFPGRTARHVTSHQVRFYQQEQLPSSLSLMQQVAGALAQQMAGSADITRKYASLEWGLQNGIKYYQESLEGLQKVQVLERKLAEEKELTDGGKDDPRAKAAAKLLGKIGAILAGYQRYYQRLALIWRLSSRLTRTTQLAYDVVKWGQEQTKPDRMRKEERYQEKNLYRLFDEAKRLDQEIDLAAEQALLLALLRYGQALAPAQRPRSIAWLLRWSAAQARRSKAAGSKAADGVTGDLLAAAVADLFRETGLFARSADPQELARAEGLRRQLLSADQATLAQHKDPFLAFARQLLHERIALEEGPYQQVEQLLEKVLHPRWVSEVKRPSYPDANFTVRLTYGSVRDYQPAGQAKPFPYMTTLTALLQKDKGAYPFAVPPGLRAAYPQRQQSRYLDPQLKDIPVNFTATLDTTGGNSGSPVLDDRGRLVGLLFDGTPEAILSDWLYLPEQRSICLDIRFALYLAELAGASELLQELGQAPRPRPAAK